MSAAPARARKCEPVARLLALGAVVALAGVLAACQGSQQPGARTFNDFKDDGVARDGVLSRCDRAPDTSANDPECVAARRAAASVALEQQRSRGDALDRQSDRKVVALRDRSGQTSEAGATASADPYDVQFPGRPAFKLGAVEPPSSEIEIVQPTLKPEDVAVRPTRLNAATN